MQLPPLTREQIRSVDRMAVDHYAMHGLVLMENAGRGCADVLCQIDARGPVAICCGKGNNAGDGLVFARHLDLRGIDVRLLMLADPEQLQGDALANWRIVERADLPRRVLDEQGEKADQIARFLDGAHWAVDGLMGTGARGAPRPPMDEAVRQMNALPARRLAIDIPSGLDCDTGQPSEPTFRADHTCTFVAGKRGFREPAAKQFLGQTHVVDIGVPRHLLEAIRQELETRLARR